MNDYVGALEILDDIMHLLDEVDDMAGLIEKVKKYEMNLTGDDESFKTSYATSSPLDTIRDTIFDVRKYITYKYGMAMLDVPDTPMKLIEKYTTKDNQHEEDKRESFGQDDLSDMQKEILSALRFGNRRGLTEEETPEDGESI